MSDRFGYSRKEKREIRQNLQNAVAKDVYRKNNADKMSATDRFDQHIFEQGATWFIMGMSLEDAPDEVRNNTNFIRGYDRAKRIALIEEMQNNDAKNNNRGSR